MLMAFVGIVLMLASVCFEFGLRGVSCRHYLMIGFRNFVALIWTIGGFLLFIGVVMWLCDFAG